MLYDADGNELDSSGNFGPDEDVQAVIQGGETYVDRVVGFASGPTTFRITSTQQVTDAANAGGSAVSESSGGAFLVRLTVDPLTGRVVASVLD